MKPAVLLLLLTPLRAQTVIQSGPARMIEIPDPGYAFAGSHDEMRKHIRENIYMGARVIKIVVDGQKYIYSEDDIRFIVNEAVAAGVAAIEHAWHLTDEDLALAVKNHVALVSTALDEAGALAQEYLDNFAEAGIPAADALRMLTANAAALKRAKVIQ